MSHAAFCKRDFIGETGSEIREGAGIMSRDYAWDLYSDFGNLDPSTMGRFLIEHSGRNILGESTVFR